MNTEQKVIAKRLRRFVEFLGLINFLDSLRFEEVLDHVHLEPSWNPKLSRYRLMEGMPLLLSIDIHRLRHSTVPIYFDPCHLSTPYSSAAALDIAPRTEPVRWFPSQSVLASHG